MSVISINEPSTSRKIVLTPQSLNEPATLPEWATEAPVVASIEPAEATIGDADFTVYVTGTGFYEQSVIVFAGQDEPTTLESDGTLSTGVNMAMWLGPDGVPVSVRNGPIMSNEVTFTFMSPEDPVGDDPDELEDEIEQSKEEGDFKSMHRPRRRR